jgi:hypothetical protein
MLSGAPSTLEAFDEVKCGFAVRGSRFAVRGSRFAVRGFAVRGSRFAVRGSRFAVRGSRFAGSRVRHDERPLRRRPSNRLRRDLFAVGGEWASV